MNEVKRNRRRFLADILFAGAALSGATFLAQSVQGQPEVPHTAGTPALPSPTPPVEPPRPGGAPLPPKPTPREPFIPSRVGGDVAAPQPNCVVQPKEAGSAPLKSQPPGGQ